MNENDLLPSLIEIRRDIHQYPELAFDLERTAGIAAKAMRDLGLEVKTEVGQSGVIADLRVPGASRAVALRADMDALPIQELRDSPFKSKIAKRAHLCGHDAHTSMLIGAARLLAARRDELKVNVRFIFQPCEELPPGGALEMIAAGCLENVDAIYALHVWPWLESGSIGICPGPCMAQADNFDIVIHGKGGHAAAPHQCIDPIVMGSQFVCELQSLVSRRVSPFDSAVVSVSEFSAGSSHNVIPQSAHLKGTVRSYKPEVARLLREGIEDLLGSRGSFSYLEGYPPLINSVESCEIVNKAANQFLSEKKVIYPADPAMFGEDFAYYLQSVPGCFIQLGCRNEQKDAIYPLHHPQFTIDEDCMAVGARLLCELAMMG